MDVDDLHGRLTEGVGKFPKNGYGEVQLLPAVLVNSLVELLRSDVEEAEGKIKDLRQDKAELAEEHLRRAKKAESALEGVMSRCRTWAKGKSSEARAYASVANWLADALHELHRTRP